MTLHQHRSVRPLPEQRVKGPYTDNSFWFSVEIEKWYDSSDKINNKRQLQKVRDKKRIYNSKGRAANL